MPTTEIHFAPLQGYTEAPYRRIHLEVCGGIASYYTPFIRIEHGQIRKKDLREALPEQNEGVHVIPQIIVSDAAEFNILADKLIAIGHQKLDVNMGCPFPPQTRQGHGSGLLPHSDKVKEILEAMTRLHDEKGITLSIKMRLGQESAEECFALLPFLNQTPLHHITMHPRIGRNQYKGELDMQSFDRFATACNVPLVFNGMLTTVEEIQTITERYPQLQGVMIGRGLLTRPTLAKEYLTGQQLTTDQVQNTIKQMHRRLLEHYETAIEGGEGQLVMKMHSFWEYMEPIFGHKAIKKILKAGSMRNYHEAVSNL